MAQIQQVRIFAPHQGLYAHERWAETVIGRIIAPAIRKLEASLDWYWFTRYVATSEEDSGDCDITRIPQDFMDTETRRYKSVRFRYSVADDAQADFEDACRTAIGDERCAISDFLPYAILDDLGGPRHVEEPRTQERRERRAQLVVENYCSVAKLILDALRGPDADGRYHLPHHEPFTGETPFQAFHHIYCNATDVPLHVRLIQQIPGDSTQPLKLQEVWHRVRF